ncbi:hypothetical protein K2173_013995 [Erythroxylum novogranatense]|uniref:CLAVATA3/ESR (CLE)-related protein 25 n=1 Tax=Erythroxylum novogranatense TaxID=1862640 RepID=A0AAV8SDG6_9ROSI|nr:hypothetical protein K2173_013995 [Erythroxylum novogranatense]
MGSGIVSPKALFRAVMFFGVVWLFYVGILADNATKMVTRATAPSAGILEHWTRFIGRERRPFHHDFDPNYVSKRRVPNGPDPIHNRRASKCRQPPVRI